MIRAQGNCAEYAPLGLLLLALVELQGWGARGGLHGTGAARLIGRIAHATAFSGPRQILSLRVSGMVLRLGAIAALSLLLIFAAIA